MSPQLLFLKLLPLLLFCAIPCSSAVTSVTKKVDQAVAARQELEAGIKCGSCPCVNPCAQLPPPPPPPPPPPKTTYCAPDPGLAPPPPRFIYVTGVPGTIYETDPYDLGFYSGAGQSLGSWLLRLVGLAILNLVIVQIW